MAVLLVMVRHMAPTYIGGAGIVGVTMFFALSGYLISGLLANDLTRFGRVRWSRFYVHRALRLYPALIAVLAIFVLLASTTNLFGAKANVIPSLVLGLTYTSDLPLPWVMSPGFTHLWTLAVEEQFYLLWPALLFIAFRSRVSLVRASVTVAIGLTLLCWITLALVAEPAVIYERPTTWATSLALGGVARLLGDRLDFLVGRGRRPVAVVAALILLLISIAPDLKDSTVAYIFGPTILAVATVALILVAKEWRTVPRPWMRPLVWLGTISYAVYLWNLPVNEAFRTIFAESPKFYLALTIPATVLIAIISWYTVEAAGRLLRQKYDARPSTQAVER